MPARLSKPLQTLQCHTSPTYACRKMIRCTKEPGWLLLLCTSHNNHAVCWLMQSKQWWAVKGHKFLPRKFYRSCGLSSLVFAPPSLRTLTWLYLYVTHGKNHPLEYPAHPPAGWSISSCSCLLLNYTKDTYMTPKKHTAHHH